MCVTLNIEFSGDMHLNCYHKYTQTLKVLKLHCKSKAIISYISNLTSVDFEIKHFSLDLMV